MPAQQLTQERVVTPQGVGEGLTVEGAKQGQAPGDSSFASTLLGTMHPRRVQCAHAGTACGRNGVLAMFGV